jgi:hypothetical protein
MYRAAGAESNDRAGSPWTGSKNRSCAARILVPVRTAAVSPFILQHAKDTVAVLRVDFCNWKSIIQQSACPLRGVLDGPPKNRKAIERPGYAVYIGAGIAYKHGSRPRGQSHREGETTWQ